eukprot:1627752-Amphidinium_carterae.1
MSHWGGNKAKRKQVSSSSRCEQSHSGLPPSASQTVVLDVLGPMEPTKPQRFKLRAKGVACSVPKEAEQATCNNGPQSATSTKP